MIEIDRKFMKRAIRLASNAGPDIKLNPPVGCVIVHNNKIIGEGYHKKYGENHAEVNAINSVSNHDKDFLKESTVYVSLEPCSHHGKTPPCAELLVENNVKRVVVGCLDPYSEVAGNGIKHLRKHDINVTLSVLKKEAQYLIKQFTTHLRKKRPYITLKWAQSRDGYISRRNKQVPISGRSMKFLVHKWRSENQAIMVGSGTVLTDNPMLNNRLMPGSSPSRVIMDRRQRLHGKENVFRDDGQTVYYCTIDQKNENIPDHVIQYILEDKSVFLEKVFKGLYADKIASVFVEGGATLHASLIETGMYDEVRLIQNKKSLNSGISAPQVVGTFIDSWDIENDKIYVL